MLSTVINAYLVIQIVELALYNLTDALLALMDSGFSVLDVQDYLQLHIVISSTIVIQILLITHIHRISSKLSPI